MVDGDGEKRAFGFPEAHPFPVRIVLVGVSFGKEDGAISPSEEDDEEDNNDKDAILGLTLEGEVGVHRSCVVLFRNSLLLLLLILGFLLRFGKYTI